MFGKLLHNEEVNAALVLALSGTIMVLLANGPRPVSLERVVSGVLSNPVPNRRRKRGSNARPRWNSLGRHES